MKRATRSQLQRLLKTIAPERQLARRLDWLSAQFLELPYVVNSLGGGVGLPEAFTCRLDAFDCVTYLETVLALALADSAEGFTKNLRRLRYRRGELSWQTRNHYMVDWWRNNEKQGLVSNLTRGKEATTRRRRLNVVPGLPEKTVSFRVFPKRRFQAVAARVATGDFVCFASAKANLDVFHTGLLIRNESEILLRHATRKAGKVIEQPLSDFLQGHRMSGLVLLRPTAGVREEKR